MSDTTAERIPAQAAVDRSRRSDAASLRDLILALAAFALLVWLFIWLDGVERLFELTRDHEAWELDELLAGIPALTVVMAWYAFRRWLEARRLNHELAGANETLKDTHARRLAAEAQLRDAHRHEAMGRLAGGLAHELNNMLQPVITLAQLTLKNEPLSEAARGNLKMILDATECSGDILGKALTFAGGKSLRKERLVLADCLREVVEFSRTVLPAGVEVDVDIPDHGESALINRTELIQVMTNLMTNAAHAMDGDGSLRVALERGALSREEAEVHGLTAGGYFKMLISDSGRGMSEDVRRRLFDPFFTTGEGDDGVGLGLAVVHGIIGDWSGRISVRSTPGSGTCFSILIPIAPE